MPIQVNGSPQSAQEQNTLDTLTQEAGQFARQAQRVTDAISEFLRKHRAAGFGESLGDASSDTYVTASSQSVTVGTYRKMLKAACSYAVVTGEMSTEDAESILQKSFGNSTETVVSAEEINELTNQWV